MRSGHPAFGLALLIAMIPACALLAGTETISGNVIDAGAGGSGGGSPTSASSSSTTSSSSSGGGGTGGGGGGCPMTTAWIGLIEGDATDVHVAVDEATKHVLVAASVTGTVTIAGTPYAPKGGPIDSDVLVVRFGSAGNVLWVKRLGGAGNERVAGLGVNDFGIYAAVNYEPSKTFEPGCTTGLGPLPNSMYTGNYAAVLELDPANGSCTHGQDLLFGQAVVSGIAVSSITSDIWTIATSQTGSLSVEHIAGPVLYGGQLGGGNGMATTMSITTVAGGGVVAGGFTGSLQDYEGTAKLQSTGDIDAFLLRWDPDPVQANYKVKGHGGVAFGAPAYQSFHRVTTDGTSVFAIGELVGTVDAGGPPLTSAGDRDVLVVKRGADLSPGWAARLGGSGTELGTGIAAASGRVFVTGSHTGGLDIAGPLAVYGGSDVFVAALDDAQQGAPVWGCSFGGSKDDDAKAIAVTKGGDVIVAGTFSGQAQFGNPVDGGSGAVFVVKLAPGQ